MPMFFYAWMQDHGQKIQRLRNQSPPSMQRTASRLHGGCQVSRREPRTCSRQECNRPSRSPNDGVRSTHEYSLGCHCHPPTHLSKHVVKCRPAIYNLPLPRSAAGDSSLRLGSKRRSLFNPASCRAMVIFAAVPAWLQF